MSRLQETIQKLEAGPWMRYVRWSFGGLLLLSLAIAYNWWAFRNFGTQEAMDSAQLARNLAEGKGYTTLFVRPVSVFLVKQHPGGNPSASSDPARLKEHHPDLANPPVYPTVLAGWMKAYQFLFKAAEAARSRLPGGIQKKLPDFSLEMDNPLWQREKRFSWNSHDFMIAVFNEALFFLVIWLTFRLARRLFDSGVAWLSSVVLLGSELLWRFSTSGLSTMLLMLIFVGLAWCLVVLEQEVREPTGGTRKLFLLASGVGLLLALGLLTRYAFGWLLLPVFVYLILFGGPRKAALCLLTLAMFLVVVSPWIYRNVKLSGLPFGTATYAVLQGTPAFPEHYLERSLAPDFQQHIFRGLMPKLYANGRTLVQDELPKLGGSWLTALFLAGLLLGFRKPGTRRLRYFAVMCLITLAIAQALGRTQLTEESPELNSENLLVLLTPLVFVFGVSLFYLMLDQMNLMPLGMPSVVIGRFAFVMVPRDENSARGAAIPIVVSLFAFVMLLPLLLTFLGPRPVPIRFPPYLPPAIQRVSSLLTERELMMSDVPWAVAWYGQRQCIWLAQDATEDFAAVNDLLKPVRALYLTPRTLDAPFASHWIKPGADGWGFFLLESIVLRRTFPQNFPLREAIPGLLPDQLFLCDRKRWLTEDPASATGSKPATPEKPAAAEKSRK